MQELIIIFKRFRIILIFITLAVFLFFSKSIAHIANDLANHPTQIYFNPQNVNMSSDTNFQLMVNSGSDQIAFIHTEITFDQTKINLTSLPQISPYFADIVQESTLSEANSSGRIILVLGIGIANKNSPPSGDFKVADISFSKIATSGQTSLKIDPETLEVVNILASDVATTLQSSLISFAIPSNTPSSTSAASPSNFVNMNFANFPGNILVGDSFTGDVILDTNGNNIIGTDLTINYDPTKLSVSKIDPSIFAQNKNLVIDNTTGKISLTLFQDVSDKSVIGDNLSILKIHFTALTQGNPLVVIANESLVAGSGENGQNLSIVSNDSPLNITNPTPTPSPTPIITPTPVYKDADINLDFHVDISDYLLLFQYYGNKNPEIKRVDINKDGAVNIKDYAILYSSFEF